MRNKAASHFLARFLSVICFSLYLMPSKSMWQSKSVIRKKVFFCPHVKQIQRLMETISFQAMVFSCSLWWMFGNPLRTRQLVWDDRQSRRHVAVNQGLQCDFDVRLFFGFALKLPVQKFQHQNMSTIISIVCTTWETTQPSVSVHVKGEIASSLIKWLSFLAENFHFTGTYHLFNVQSANLLIHI